MLPLMSSPSSVDAPSTPSSADPADYFYESQDLRLHYADWGNEAAPPLILIHGGRDHCRSWDAVALSLRAHFHVMAPDLRGHGDSDWAKGSSYSLSDYVYDVTRLLRAASVHQTAIVGHSMGGMIALMYAGAYPDHVSHLALLDGVTVVPGSPRKPIHQRIRIWSSDCFTEARRLALKTGCCSAGIHQVKSIGGSMLTNCIDALPWHHNISTTRRQPTCRPASCRTTHASHIVQGGLMIFSVGLRDSFKEKSERNSLFFI